MTKFKQRQRLMASAAFLFLFAACASPQTLPTDDELIAQWTQSRAELRSLIESCASAPATAYSLAERYQADYPLIPTTTVENLKGCELPSNALETGLQLQHLAKMPDDDAYLLVTHQYRKGTGLIEESISRWTGGWISWKTSILEEKGFVYISEKGAAEGLRVSELPLRQMSITDAPLDQFSGEYRVTSQVSGNGCEVWRVRPTEPGWYLFYHQVRECAV